MEANKFFECSERDEGGEVEEIIESSPAETVAITVRPMRSEIV